MKIWLSVTGRKLGGSIWFTIHQHILLNTWPLLSSRRKSLPSLKLTTLIRFVIVGLNSVDITWLIWSLFSIKSFVLSLCCIMLRKKHFLRFWTLLHPGSEPPLIVLVPPFDHRSSPWMFKIHYLQLPRSLSISEI